MPFFYPQRQFRTGQSLPDTIQQLSRIRPQSVNQLPTGAFNLYSGVGTGGPSAGGPVDDPLDPGSPGLPGITTYQQEFTLTDNTTTNVDLIEIPTGLVAIVGEWTLTRGTATSASGTFNIDYWNSAVKYGWMQTNRTGLVGITSIAASISGSNIRLTFVLTSTGDDIIIDFQYRLVVRGT